MRRGRLGDTKGLNAAGPDDLLRLSLTGDSKRGRAAAPLRVVWRKPPPGGGKHGGSQEDPTCVCCRPGPQRAVDTLA
jgi:hypothetical protein